MSEADQEWKPSGRPTSTMAQAFSASLDSAFSLDTDVTQLSQTVDQKKQQMIIQSRELEALQKKIRDAEERLKAREPGASSQGSSHQNGTGKREDDGRSTGTPFASSASSRAARFFGRGEQPQEPQEQTTNNS